MGHLSSYWRAVCDGTQNFKRYRYRYFIPVPNISDTDTGTFFGTKFFRYRFRDFFPVPIFNDTGSDTTRKNEISRYRYLYDTDTHHKSYKFLNFGDVNKGFSSETFSGTKFFRYRFRDFFPVPNFSDTGSETFFRYQFFPIPVPRLFSVTNFFRYRFRYHKKNEQFPVPGIPGTGTSHSDISKS